MIEDWKCHRCGGEARYSNKRKKYCVKLWNVFLGFKPMSFACKKKENNEIGSKPNSK